ncbi:uncharacterized protein Hap1MRO34_014737 isoform 2-T2 [Clarias gariepinus]|nr:uncharacterized protein LOC128534376 isoform X2 [Clarias gariepinus]
MKIFSILVFLVLVLKAVASVPAGYTMAKLNQSVTLLCTGRCSGVMKWIQPRNKGVCVAGCDQTSCWSEVGYELSHDQYVRGNLSLTITAAEYSKRTWYTCRCDGRDVCDVILRIEPLEVTRHMKHGEALHLDLPITENVEVTFKQSADDGSIGVCTVDGRKLECDSGYKSRASLKSSLTLSEVKDSDCGVYTVQDTENKEVIASYTVTGCKAADQGAGAVPVSQTHNLRRRSVSSEEKPCPEQESRMPAWGIALMVVMFLVIIVLTGVIVRLQSSGPH